MSPEGGYVAWLLESNITRGYEDVDSVGEGGMDLPGREVGGGALLWRFSEGGDAEYFAALIIGWISCWVLYEFDVFLFMTFLLCVSTNEID